MAIFAHIAIFLLYAAGAVVVALWLPDFFPALEPFVAWLAAAMVFMVGALAHEVMARRSDELDLFDEVYELRVAHNQAIEEIGRLKDQIEKSQPADRRTELVEEMRQVRAMLSQLVANKHEPPLVSAASAIDTTGRIVEDDPAVLGPVILNGDVAGIDVVKSALSANRIELYLQPVVTLPQRKVRFYECLSRIRDGHNRIIEPNSYLKIAEAEGLIVVIDNFLLFQCVQLVRRLRKSDHAIAFFCNISGHTLQDDAFFEQFLDYLENNPELVERLIFEFSETDMIDRDRRLGQKLRLLTDLGYRLSVDGVSSVDVDYGDFARKGVHYMKIDAGILLNGADSIDGTVDINDLRLAMAESGIHLVAGRVENENAVVGLLEHNVDLAQGYLFGEPRPSPQDL